MRNTTRFDTPEALIYHLCTALKPIVCFLYHITSYTTPSASFNFDETSSTYSIQIKLYNKHSKYEAHDLLRYAIAPFIPPKANIMHFMPHNFLLDPLSLFQFRSNFINALVLDKASKKNIVNMRHTTPFDTPQALIYHLSTALNSMLFMSHYFLYFPLSLFRFR